MRDNIKAMKIRNIDLGEKPVLLAPMEDVTDPAFRLMCKQFGADMVYTEFVSSDALIRSVGKTMLKLNISEKERPVAIQIYGKDTDTMVEAARIVEQAKPDILDLNFGCPVKRVAGKGAGSGMLQNVPKMLEITRAVVDAVKIPVTVKTRLGWDAEHKIIVELAETSTLVLCPDWHTDDGNRNLFLPVHSGYGVKTNRVFNSLLITFSGY